MSHNVKIMGLDKVGQKLLADIKNVYFPPEEEINVPAA